MVVHYSLSNFYVVYAVIFSFLLITCFIEGTVLRGGEGDIVCYPLVGCFVGGEGPMAHMNRNPSDPQDIQTEFLLWTRGTPVESPVVMSSLAENQLANITDIFDPAKRLVIVIHGFGDSGYSDWVVTMISRYLARIDVNAVAVHWPKGADKSNYLVAARNTELIGRQLGNFLDSAMALGLPPSNIHLIGHSLGSQIANFAVNWLRRVSEVVEDFTPGRISGLDPAGPFFCDGDYGVDTYLEATDGDFVDIYHSNQGLFIYGNVGCLGELGHVDFYPNGGYDQPDCPNPIIGVIEDMFTGDGFNAACSHFRAVHIFSESLVADPGHFVAFPCPGLDDFDNDFLNGDCFECEPNEDYLRGCGKAGISAPHHGNGSLYFPTFGDKDPSDGIGPLGGRMIRISVMSSSDQERITWGQFTVNIMDSCASNGRLGPYFVTTTDSAITQGEIKRKVILDKQSFTADIDTVEIELMYTAFDGFFQDGQLVWLIDAVVVEDDLENRFYGCFEDKLLLDTGVAVALSLVKSNDEPLC